MSTPVSRDTKKKLAQFSNLPSIPSVIFKIKQTSENPKSSVADLANCILSDHQLTTRILRMANSAYYGDFSGSIETVTQAIVLMGFRAVRNIAISMGVYGMVSNLAKDNKFDITAFWTRSLASGVICKYLTQRLGQSDLIEAAFIAGFMHDIGQVILAAVFPEEYSQISDLKTNPVNLDATERAVLGIDHLEAGNHVASKWSLPAGLTRVISEHHRAGLREGDRSPDLLVDVVYVSDRVYPFLMSDVQANSKGYAAVTAVAGHLIGVSEQAMADLLTECRGQVAEIAMDLEIDIDSRFGQQLPADAESDDIHQKLARKDIQLAFLQNVTSALTGAETEDQILQIICETIYRGMQMGRVAVFQYDKDGKSVSGRVGFGFESQHVVQSLRFSASEGFFASMLEAARPVSVISDKHALYGTLVTSDETDRLGADTFAAVPMTIAEQIRFVIYADLPSRETPINDEHLKSMSALAEQAALSLERNLFRTAWLQLNRGATK